MQVLEKPEAIRKTEVSVQSYVFTKPCLSYPKEARVMVVLLGLTVHLMENSERQVDQQTIGSLASLVDLHQAGWSLSFAS